MNFHPDRCSNAEQSSIAHLTSDQIDGQLIGDLADAPAAHLAACALCTTRVAAAADPLASFQQVSAAWSERCSATLPIPVPAPQQPIWQRHMAWATACLTLAVGIAVVNASHQFAFQTAEPQPTPSTTATAAIAPQMTAQLQAAPLQTAKIPAPTETASIAPSPRAAQIATDNRMLRSIEASFDPSADSPAALGLLPAGSQSASPPTSLQD